jgi:anti-sigma28 factor (negative regulator of flagellin synthesis)
MKISDIKPVSGPPKAKAVDGTGPDTDAHIPRDRVSVQATKEAASASASAVSVAQQAAGGRRTARAEQLEAEVRSGGYRPDPGRVAEQILADAEIDARISALLKH